MYIRGKNRLFYQTNDLDGESIYIDILNPELERTDKLLMTYAGENLYYIDIWFRHLGAYVIRTFKDNVKLSHNVIQVDTGGGNIFYPEVGKLI